jgi:hypothetical protein
LLSLMWASDSLTDPILSILVTLSLDFRKFGSSIIVEDGYSFTWLGWLLPDLILCCA